MNQVITITFGDCAENHTGMEQLGKLRDKGFSLKEMNKFKKHFDKKYKTKLYDLTKLVKEDVDYASILVVKDFLKKGQNKLHKELTSHSWDTKYYDVRRGKVLNKHARANVCYGDQYQKADFENKKGTIIAWDSVPRLHKIKKKLEKLTKCNLQAEGNFYTDGGIKKTGIGYHGDTERRIVIAIRTGNNTMPLHYQWYHQSKRIGENFQVDIEPGDLYIMSEKAVGTDWKKRSLYTLRHSTGAAKYTK